MLVFAAFLLAGCTGSIHGFNPKSEEVEPVQEIVPLKEKLTDYPTMSIHVHVAEGVGAEEVVVRTLRESLVRTVKKAKPGPEVFESDVMGALDLRATIRFLDRIEDNTNFWGEIPETMVVLFEVVEPTQGRVLASFESTVTRRNDPEDRSFAKARSSVMEQVKKWIWSKKNTKQRFVDSFAWD